LAYQWWKQAKNEYDEKREKLRLMDKFAHAESQLVSNAYRILNYTIKKLDKNLESCKFLST
jgi:hypothetical protein